MSVSMNFLLIPCCSFSARTETIARIILLSVSATLLFSPSVCVFFLVYALFFCSGSASVFTLIFGPLF